MTLRGRGHGQRSPTLQIPDTPAPPPLQKLGPVWRWDAQLAPCKETLGTEAMGMPHAPWVTPVTVGKGHLGDRRLTARAPAKAEALSPQWRGS